MSTSPGGYQPIRTIFELIPAMRTFQSDVAGLLRNGFAQFGDVYTMEVMGNRQYMIAHPDHLREVLVEKADHYHKTRDYSDPKRGMARFVGNGLLTSDGEFWKRQRKLVAPALHAKRIAAYADTMVSMGQTMLEGWRDGARLDVAHEMMTVTMKIVAKSLFNVDVSADVERIGGAMDVMQEMQSEGLLVSLLPMWVPTPQRLREARAVRDLDEIMYSLIRDWRTHRQDRGDLMSMLMMAVDDDGSTMTDKQVRDELVTLFLAGHETTANTLNWAFVLLAQNPEVEARLHHELDVMLNGQPPTLEDLKRLPYTERVVKEVLRLYPVAWSVARQAITDTSIGGYAIPKGTDVGLIFWQTHLDPRWWDEPERFMPERFEGDVRHRYAYLPFGAGPRVCIGNSFAMMEAQLLLATIAQRYRLHLAPGQVVQPEPLITIRPKGGLPMRLEQRERVRVMA